MIKLYTTCFRDKEAVSAIRSLSRMMEKCPYDNDREAHCVYVDEYADILYDFFAIFEESEEGRPFVELLHEDWELFNEDMPGYRRFLDALLEDLHISIAAGTKVTYISSIRECVGLWDKLKQTLIGERRFILKNGESPADYEWDRLLLPNLQMGADETLYRARINEENTPKYQNTEMSAPPVQKTPDGRANSAGIPVLYLCKDRETAAYEVRALHNDAITIGEFKVVKGVKLDIVDFTAMPSIFNDAGSLDAAMRYLLMRRISRDLSRPMRRYSRKTEYVPTQYICEFIRFVIGADAIQFASSLNEGGINLVVFDPHKMECVGTQLYTVSDYQLKIQQV